VRGPRRDLAGPLSTHQRRRGGGRARPRHPARGQVRRRAPARRHHLRQGRPQAAPPGRPLQHGPRVAVAARARRLHPLPRQEWYRELRRARFERHALGGLRGRDRRGPGRHLRVRRALRRAPRRDVHDRRDEPRTRAALLPAHAQQGGHRRRRPRGDRPRRARHAHRRGGAHRQLRAERSLRVKERTKIELIDELIDEAVEVDRLVRDLQA
jgi:hypothetical protein